MIYLASPYSHPDWVIRVRRFLAARDFTYAQIAEGNIIFSPIVYCHQFAQDLSAPFDAKAWQSFNLSIFKHCTELWLLHVEGWKESAGVMMERTWAETKGIPIRHKEPPHYAAL